MWRMQSFLKYFDPLALQAIIWHLASLSPPYSEVLDSLWLYMVPKVKYKALGYGEYIGSTLRLCVQHPRNVENRADLRHLLVVPAHVFVLLQLSLHLLEGVTTTAPQILSRGC